MKKLSTLFALFLLLASAPLFSMSNGPMPQPDCSKPDNWAASMAFVYLKNNKLTDNNKIDFAKTKVERVASEPKAEGIFRQVHLVTYVEKTGKKFQLITVNDASLEECSMGKVDAYLINRVISE